MDAFADSLLNDERVCEIQLPRHTQRKVLEETEGLAARRSKLGRAMGVLGVGEVAGSDDEEDGADRGRYLSRSPSGSRSPSPVVQPGLKGEQEFWTEGSEDESEADAKSEASEGRYVSRSPTPEP